MIKLRLTLDSCRGVGSWETDGENCLQRCLPLGGGSKEMRMAGPAAGDADLKGGFL